MNGAAQRRASIACNTTNESVNEIFQSRFEGFEVCTQIGHQVANHEREQVFALYDGNMRCIFESIGEYDRDEKYEEIFNKESRIVMLLKDTRVIAFVSFRFDTEEGEDDRLYSIIYLYELQVKEEWRGNKIGKCCIHSLLSLVKQLNLDKIMLTVSKHNPLAIKFYTSNQFQFDEIDPSWYEGGEDENYHIMSRA